MASTGRAPLNCIVDDSVLVASVRSGSPHSIQPWLAANAINVFVPISALERLSALRNINCPVSGDAQMALIWLDEVTTSTATKGVGRVQLQGPDDQYMTWQEVEKYLLPETPLSRSGNGAERVDALSKMLDRNANTISLQTAASNKQAAQKSPSASPTSSASSMSSTHADGAVEADESSSALSAHGIPPSVRSLLNFVVWRTHHNFNLSAETGKYIVVTNDPIIQKQASKFGVRAKLLSQLENILTKEGVQPVYDASIPETLNGFGAQNDDEFSDDEDRVVFDPSKRPTPLRSIPPSAANVIDPDHFGRDNKIPTVTPSNSKPQNGSHSVRGGRGTFVSRRGRLSPPGQSAHANHLKAPSSPQRGRGVSSSPVRGVAFSPRANGHIQSQPRGGVPRASSRGAANGMALGGRGVNAGFRGRGTQHLPFAPRGAGFSQARNHSVPKPIDPDSFARPSPFGRGRGRGTAMHRLWEPTSNG